MSAQVMKFAGWGFLALSFVPILIGRGDGDACFIAAVVFFVGGEIVSRLPTPPHTGKE